jgi:hypothetical protein
VQTKAGFQFIILYFDIMPQSRQLVAIMFTDIVGYTALMGRDSAKALELIRISKEIQKPPGGKV